jgi:hypothetical protein
LRIKSGEFSIPASSCLAWQNVMLMFYICLILDLVTPKVLTVFMVLRFEAIMMSLLLCSERSFDLVHLVDSEDVHCFLPDVVYCPLSSRSSAH